MQLHGKNWRDIRELVPTRSSSQIRTHAQKFFLKIQTEINTPDILAYVRSKPAEDFVDNKKPYAKLTVGKVKTNPKRKERSETKEVSKEKSSALILPPNQVIKVNPIRRHLDTNSMNLINHYTDNSWLLLNTSINLNELYGKIVSQWLLLHNQACRKQQEQVLEHLSACASRLSKVSTELSITLRLLSEPQKDLTKLKFNDSNLRSFD